MQKEYAGIARVGARFFRNKKEVTEAARESDEKVSVEKFETTPAVVTRGYGVTLNIGNFESARIDVSIQMPCYAEDVEEADAWAAAWVEQRLEKEVESVRGSKPSKSEALAKPVW